MKRPLPSNPPPPPATQKADDRTSLVRLYLIVCAYRIVNALLIQTQFDADEYWQCLEPAYCLAFHTDSTEYGCAYTWEWTRRFEDPGSDVHQSEYISSLHMWLDRVLHGPVRSFVPVMPTYVFYVLARWLKFDTAWMIARGPLVVNAVLVAAPTDIATIYISRWMMLAKSNSI